MKENQFFRPSSLILVYLLSANNKNNISQIAKEFKAYPGNMTRTLDNFISLGLLKKEEKEGKKEVKISLTKKGKNVAENIKKIIKELN